MEKLAKQIVKLKQMTLQQNIQFADAVHYFLDLMNIPEFLAAGTVIDKHRLFQKIVKQTIDKIGEKLQSPEMYLVQVRRYNLLHGAIFLKSHQPSLMYFFEDIHSGILSIGDLTGQNRFVRLMPMDFASKLSGDIIAVDLHNDKA